MCYITNMSDEPKKNEPFDETEGDPTESDDVVEFEYNEDGEEDLKKTLKKLRVLKIKIHASATGFCV